MRHVHFLRDETEGLNATYRRKGFIPSAAARSVAPENIQNKRVFTANSDAFSPVTAH